MATPMGRGQMKGETSRKLKDRGAQPAIEMVKQVASAGYLRKTIPNPSGGACKAEPARLR